MSESRESSGSILAGMDPSILRDLACPACHGVLALRAASSFLACAACGRRYPVVDGIPVLIAGRAEQGPRD